MSINYGQGTPERPSRGSTLFITATVMVILAGFFVGIRLAVRFKAKLFGWDDYTIIAALFCSIILTLCINLSVVHGYGIHTADLTHTELTATLGWFYGAQVIYKVLLGLNKVSMLFLYLRIFLDRTFRLICWVTLGFVIAWSFGSMMATIFQCIPVNAYWDKTIKNPKCTDSDAFWYAYAIINIITDVFILIMPVWEIKKLHLPWQQRAAVIGIFALGGFVCATSIIRTNAVAASTANKKDSTWTFIARSSWTLAESNVGIICTCLPMLRSPLIAIFPCLKGRTSTIKPTKDSYPLSATTNTWARSDGRTMSSDKSHVNNSEEDLSIDKISRERGSDDGIMGQPSQMTGIVKKTDVEVRFGDH